MASYAQFILWKAVPRNDGTGKVDKLPVNPATGGISDAHDSSIWLPVDAALAAAASHDLGVGFVFAPSDPFFFFDIDDCLEPSGQWSDWANYLCATFQGAAVEISHSGNGLHIFGIGQAPANRRKKARGAPFDLYTEGRFAALTGNGAMGDAGTDHTAALQSISAAYLTQEPGLDSGEWTTEPEEGYLGPADDEALIARMLRSKSASAILGGKASLVDLWNGNADALGVAYPHDQGLEPFDWSDADMALCCHLAFWTGKDCERMDRLFRASGLVRDKWLDREQYRRTTILKAVALCNSVYTPAQRPEQAPVAVGDLGPVAPGETRAGFQYLAFNQQLEHFSGCTYVRDMHRIFTPDGALLKSEQFKATYGGYVFALDSISDKVSRNAWEVFTESQALQFPKAHSVCFRPECAPGAIIEEEGSKLVNTYIPVETVRTPGDPTPFLAHVAKLLPDPDDQAILLAYMAACVQYKGVKFQWAPLLQGVEGNGKSLLGAVLTASIGKRYTHKANPKDIGNVFNAWISGKLLAIIEEVYTADRKDVIDTLKWLITDDRVPVTPKGVDQITGDNRANFILTTNHKDAIRKTKRDRRYCVFFTAQQEPCDIRRDGMGGQYFPQLYAWLRGGGYAVVNDFLQSYAIPAELNPAVGCHRAPDTSSTIEAIAMGLGGVEQELLEAIDEGRPGFAGGWVSSMAFDRLIDDRRDSKRIPRNRRRGILQELGYDLHPALKGGRVNSVIPIDNGKPRLYIRDGHIAQNIAKAADVANAYVAAQGAPGAIEVPGAAIG
jgi:hypothetical protein